VNGVSVAEVFRGMPVGAAPLRLDRAPTAAATPRSPALPQPVQAADAAAAAHEQSVREGFERGRHDGHRAGREAGHEEGLRRGREEAAGHTHAAVEQAVGEATLALRQEQGTLRALARKLESALVDCVSAGEDEMVALCFETICAVLGAHALQPAVIRQHLQHVLSRWGARDRVALHLHPQDARLLASCGLPASGAVDAGAIRYVPDPQVALGGCILRGEGGGLDARLETALLACKDALIAARSRPDPQAAVGPGAAA
jgi:flagellar assembly protein FliH